MKYKCTACGYIYDDNVEAVNLKIYQMIGFVLYVVLEKNSLKK